MKREEAIGSRQVLGRVLVEGQPARRLVEGGMLPALRRRAESQSAASSEESSDSEWAITRIGNGPPGAT